MAYGSGLVLGRRLGDLYGRRRMFVTGVAVFTLASIACGLAPSVSTLVAARVVQGASAALLAPQVLALLRAVYSGRALTQLTGMSRATAQRYLTHLHDLGRCAVRLRYGSAGRPEHGYRWMATGLF